MEIKVYGKQNCTNCEKIKKELQDMELDFEYLVDDKKTMEKAIELKNKGELVEMIAPLVIVDGKQIKHKDINTL